MNPPTPIRRAWTVYAALLTAAIVMGEAWNLGHGAVDARTLANWVLTLVLLLATWGYALQRRIGAHRYWGPAFWVVSAATLITTIPAARAGRDAIAVVALMLLLVAPAFYAAYRYAFHSPQVWRPREVGK
jgi:xanthine/uracil permease